MLFTRSIREKGSGQLIDADALPTIGIVRLDTGAVVVAAGTPMVRDALGRYSYELVNPDDGVTYRASYSIPLNGRTIASASERTAGVDDDVTAASMVLLIKKALRTAPGAVVSVVVDGQTVQYSRAQALEELKFWQREAAKEAGTRPRAMSINLSGF